MSSQGTRPTFACAIQVSSAELRISYRVTNDADRRLGLFNRISAIRLDGTADYNPNNVYVDLEGRRLLVRKIVLPIPPDLKVGARDVPGITLVDRKSVFSEEIRLPLPILACNPYRRALIMLKAGGGIVAADQPVRAEEVEFSIGTFAVQEGWRFDPVSAAHPEIFRVWPPGPPVDAQRVVSQTERPPAGVEAHDYRVLP
jgi:hypothetical protein